MKKWMQGAAALGLLIATGTGAQAADKAAPKKKVYKAEPREAVVMPPPAWTGSYAGVSAGLRWSDATWTTTSIVPPPVGTLPASQSFSSRAFRVGGYFGQNWQTAPTTIMGWEADFGWIDKMHSIGGIPGTYTGAGAAAALANDSSAVKQRWDASFRGRYGYLLTPSWLAYATAGLAWQNVETSASCAVAGGYCAVARTDSVRKTLSGWTVGGGLETMLGGGWMARAEYRYADYRRMSQTAFAGTGDDVNYELKLKTHTALIGFAYPFGAGTLPGPVSAKY